MSGLFRTRVRFLVAALALVGLSFSTLAAQEGADGYQTPAAELTALVDAPATPGVSFSPDRSVMLISARPSLPSIAEVSAPELRIAGMRINPRNNGRSRSRPSIGLSIQTLDGTERPVSGLPSNPAIGSTRWSPDGQHVAFTHDAGDHIELWVVDVEAAAARRLGTVAVNGAYGSAVRWASNDAVLANLVPEGRGSAPEKPRVPTGPIVQENTGEVAPARTYQDLLKNQHDEDLFEYYATTQLALVSLDGSVTEVGEPAIIRSVSPSPDGDFLLVQTSLKPFSYLVPASRFPTRIEVWDAAGNPVHLVTELPLNDKVPTSFGSVAKGVRSIGWRQDADATLFWAEAQDGGDARAEADIRDAVMMLEAPFTGAPTAIASLPLRYGGVFWSEDGFALVNESSTSPVPAPRRRACDPSSERWTCGAARLKNCSAPKPRISRGLSRFWTTGR